MPACEEGARTSFFAQIASVISASEDQDESAGFFIVLQNLEGDCSVTYVQVPGPEPPFGCEVGKYLRASGTATIDVNGTRALKDTDDLSCQ